MKIKDLTNDSSLINLDANEAANVCGGRRGGRRVGSLNYSLADNYPSLGSDRINLLLDQGYELSDIVASAGDNPSLRYAQFMDFGYLT